MNASTDPRDRLILALDRPDAASALSLVDACGSDLRWVKVGLELFVAEGPPVVRAMRERDKRVFLDLKLHDIPNTVAGAVRSAASLGAELLTLHAEGGPAMMRAAAEARDAVRGPKLLAVTVLTSLSGAEYPEIYADADVARRVRVFALTAEGCGVDGVVCSPQELTALRDTVGEGFLRVTPGIRPAGSDAQDQARIATPERALADGASHLVIGRAVTGAAAPAAALREILATLGG